MGKALSSRKVPWNEHDDGNNRRGSKHQNVRTSAMRNPNKRHTPRNKRDSAARSTKEKAIKLVLFGTGEAGKTTIMRQMRLTHGNHLKEKTELRGNILVNVVEGAGMILKYGKENLGIGWEDDEAATIVLQEYEKILSKTYFDATNYLLGAKTAKAIKSLCTDNDDFNSILEFSRDEFQIFDGWDYLKNRLIDGFPEWGGPSWIPDFDDLLHARVRTTGRVILDFYYDEMKYQLIDVGGQRVERRKFFHIFQDIDAMLFVASLSEYNQRLFENKTVNRFTETIDLWNQTVNHPNFSKTWFLVLLNKTDILKEKFFDRKVKIEPEFDCPSPPPLPEEDDANCTLIKKWFEEVFESYIRIKERKQRFRVYFTNAIEKKSVSNVIQLCSSFLKHNFAASNVA